MFLKALEGLLTLFILISIGLFLSKKKIIEEKSLISLSNIVVRVAIPAFLFYTIVTEYTKEKLIYIFTSFQVPFLNIVILTLFAAVVAKIFKIEKKNEGSFISMSALSNTIFMGVPVATSILGAESIAYVSIYYIVNTTLFWIIGAYYIKKDADVINGKKAETKTLFQRVISVIKQIFNFTVIVFIAAVICVFAEIKIPNFAMQSLKYLGVIGTPLAMIYIGASLYDTIKDGIVKNFKTKDLIIITIMRFVISPLTVYIMLKYTDLPILLKQTFILIAAMPVMNQTSILAKALGADDRYSSVAIVVTSVLLPIFLLGFIFAMSRGII